LTLRIIGAVRMTVLFICQNSVPVMEAFNIGNDTNKNILVAIGGANSPANNVYIWTQVLQCR